MNRLLVAAGLLLLAAALAICLAPPASGRVYDGLDIVLEQLPEPAKSGQLFSGKLKVLADRDLELTDLTIEGDSWSQLTWSPVTGQFLSQDQPLIVEFSGIPSRADAPLTIIARSDKKAARRIMVLGGEEYERSTRSLPTKTADFPVPDPWQNQWAKSITVEPAEYKLELDTSSDDGQWDIPAEDRPKGRDIRIRGRFVYVREGTTVLGADGMTINVFDDDPIADDLLGVGITDAYGYFDFTVHWESQPFQTHPDLLVVLYSENTEVQVRRVGAIYPYNFRFGPYNNYSASEWDLGVGLPAEESDQAIAHLISNYTRFWRYVYDLGHDTRFLEVRWPGDEDDGAYYNRPSETIQLARSNQWESGTQSHEYGHHIMNCLSELPDIDYCNGICDGDLPWECGHCVWCEEDGAIAWSEGWANYTGHQIPRTFDARYGFDCIHVYGMGVIAACHIDSLFGDPLITEGFPAAALADIVDSTWDDDAYSPGFDDRADLTDKNMFDVLDSDHAMRTMDYLHDLKEHFPADKEDIWWTAMNNGFDIDEEDPDPVYPVICTSHQENVSSPNPDLHFYWQRPDDDASGVAAYGTFLSPYGYPADPGPHVDTMETNMSYTDLEPGTYYFSVKTVDNAGNWSDTYTSAGPFIITPPQPINLIFEMPTGWDYYIVPSNTTDVTLNSCPLPTTLDSMEPTYWNLAARNSGDLYTGADTYSALLVDGVQKDSYNWGNLPGWCPFVVMNNGPELVVGGLHTITGCLDPGNLVSETVESDNLIGKQYAWRPPVIDPGTLYTNGLGVPQATAGWSSLGSMWAFYNCYGLTFHSSGWWNAFVMWSDHLDVDYDLRLHEVSEEPLGGFLFANQVSSQPAGWVDAVLVNRNTLGNTAWDAAVLNHDGYSGNHRFRHVRSVEVAYGDSIAEVMSADQYVLLREFQVDYLETGGISLDLWTEPAQANVSFSWRDADFTTGDILDADAYALTGADGHAHLEVEALEEGYTCLMICRQPQDGDDDLVVKYRIRPTLPDLVPAQVAGWHAPIVPRPDTAGGPTGVALPTVLNGDVSGTWFNYAVKNQSAGTAWGAMRFYIRVDDGYGSFNELHLFDFDGHETKVFNDDGPRQVQPGRHSVVLDLDRYNYMVELNDDNNTYGEQYIWTPAQMYTGDKDIRMTTPDMIAGWTDLSTSGPLFYNCDGVRAAHTNAYWRAIAVMPEHDADVDLRLHEAIAGVKNGFGTNLARSSWGPAQSDYVLVNYNLTDWRAFDAGVLAVDGYEEYAVEVQHERWLGSGASTYGPVTMEGGEILDVYECQLPVGTWRVKLTNNSGEVDWGLSFHRGDTPYLTKSDVLEGGAAWFEPGGMDEQVAVTITEETYYSFVVWKVGAADLELIGTYSIEVMPGAPSAVDEDSAVPSVTRVAGVYPNPFNPQTTVEFELAQSSLVDLAVYDVKGKRVATLVRETYPTGRHNQVWRGKDEQGQQVASGMYFIRLKTKDTLDLHKIMLVK